MSAATMDSKVNVAASAPLAIFRLRNFRLLWAGQAISLLGDQFYMIALPWLVLQLTGDGLAVGAVLALAGLPRAVFMLVGGAITDRFTPRAVMLGSNLMRLGLVSLLALAVFTGRVELWMLYILAFLFGVADAFFYPAESAIVPDLVDESQLQTGNAVIQGTAQLSLFLGPVAAGGLIALLSGSGVEGNAAPGMLGLAAAFGIDALTFLVSAVTLWFIRAPRRSVAPDESEGVWTAIRSGLRYAWGDTTLRVFFIVVAAVATLINGVMAVGLPVLADTRLAGGAAAFGLVMSAFGAGALLGTVLAGVLPKPRDGQLGVVLLLATSLLGVGLILLGFVQNTLAAALTGLLMGAGNGYVLIQFITWLQTRTPPEMLGRMMSLLMFAAVGLVPVSTAVAGALIGLNLTLVFAGAGLLLLLVVALGMRNPEARAMGS